MTAIRFSKSCILPFLSKLEKLFAKCAAVWTYYVMHMQW